jgi:SET domain-containing protein
MSGGKARPAGPVKLPPGIRRKRSGLHGWGIFARDFIPQDARVIEYVGERITKAEAQRREDRRLVRRATGGDGCVYIFEVNLRHDIDGDVRWNPARHINHSCAPNCEAQMDRGRIWIVARRDIAPGEELTYDYGFSFSESRHHPCRCGARECAGFIVEQAQRWRLRRKPAGPA